MEEPTGTGADNRESGDDQEECPDPALLGVARRVLNVVHA
jgi:hypothetical protein